MKDPLRRSGIGRAVVVGFLTLVVAPALQAQESTPAEALATCMACHASQDSVKSILRTRHAATADPAAPFADQACMTCHGASEQHRLSPANAPDIRFGSKGSAGETLHNEVCLGCHEGNAGKHWQGSAHESMDVGCVACHDVHAGFPKLLNAVAEPETCVKCHQEQRAGLRKRSTHPLLDPTRSGGGGKMACSSCHQPHGSVTDKLIAANSVNDQCYSCHQEKKAPVLWEHSVVKEDCLACHNPHGSNHEMLLTAKEPRLCQQCHEQGRHQSLAGQAAGFFVANRGCSNCHASIHGTNNPSGIKIKN